jgi:TonB family protein
MATTVKYRNGLIGTCLFHGMLLFLLFYLAFRTPLPLPAEQGILVDFGNSDMGFGNFEPRMSDPAPVQPRPETSRPSRQEQNLTQDFEETVAVPTQQPRQQTTETPIRETPRETPQTQPPVEQPPPVQRTPDARAMFPGRGDPSSGATSQGEAGGQGNQGVPTGAPDVHVYGQGGDAAGNRWGLTGRGLVGSLPLPAYSVQDEGIVVVTITVDKDGNVIRAVPGARGSTTLNRTLLDAAERAARQAKFTRNPTAVEQSGSITYIFKLQGD